MAGENDYRATIRALAKVLKRQPMSPVASRLGIDSSSVRKCRVTLTRPTWHRLDSMLLMAARDKHGRDQAVHFSRFQVAK
jgi:hypothetical protein